MIEKTQNMPLLNHLRREWLSMREVGWEPVKITLTAEDCHTLENEMLRAGMIFGSPSEPPDRRSNRAGGAGRLTLGRNRPVSLPRPRRTSRSTHPADVSTCCRRRVLHDITHSVGA